MQVRWHPEARREVDETATFYRSHQPGLERRFLDILEDALRRIRRRPRIYPKIEGEIRKCRLPRFPFGVIYRAQSEEVQILAVMHLRREPGYWKRRTGE